VLAPCPGECPLFTIRIYRLCGVQVRKDVPIHHLELFAEPLCIEGPTVAYHSSCPCLLRSGDDSSGCDGHSSTGGIAAVLQNRDDVQSQRSIDVLLARTILSRCSHFNPLCNGLFKSIVIRLAPPHVLWHVMPSSKEALLRTIALERLGHIPYLGHLVWMEEARLDDRTTQPAVPDIWASTLVFETPAIPVSKSDVNRYLGDHHRSVTTDKLSTNNCHRGLLIIASGARPATTRTLRRRGP